MKKILIAFFIVFLLGCGGYKNYIQQNSKGAMILNGRVNRNDLINNLNFRWFKAGYNSYQPKTEAIQKIKPLLKGMKVMVFGGTWCSDTQRELPRFYKLADAVELGDANIEMIMMDEKKHSVAFNASVLNITNVPTFIFLKDGKEVCRIVEKSNKSIEEDLLELLKL